MICDVNQLLQATHYLECQAVMRGRHFYRLSVMVPSCMIDRALVARLALRFCRETQDAGQALAEPSPAVETAPAPVVVSAPAPVVAEAPKPAAVQPAAVQPAVVQPAVVQPVAPQPAAVQPAAVPAASVQSAAAPVVAQYAQQLAYLAQQPNMHLTQQQQVQLLQAQILAQQQAAAAAAVQQQQLQAQQAAQLQAQQLQAQQRAAAEYKHDSYDGGVDYGKAGGYDDERYNVAKKPKTSQQRKSAPAGYESNVPLTSSGRPTRARRINYAELAGAVVSSRRRLAVAPMLSITGCCWASCPTVHPKSYYYVHYCMTRKTDAWLLGQTCRVMTALHPISFSL